MVIWFLMAGKFPTRGSWSLHLQHRNLQIKTDTSVQCEFTAQRISLIELQAVKVKHFSLCCRWNPGLPRSPNSLPAAWNVSALAPSGLTLCLQTETLKWMNVWISNEISHVCGWFLSYPEDKENERWSHLRHPGQFSITVAEIWCFWLCCWSWGPYSHHSLAESGIQMWRCSLGTETKPEKLNLTRVIFIWNKNCTFNSGTEGS